MLENKIIDIVYILYFTLCFSNISVKETCKQKHPGMFFSFETRFYKQHFYKEHQHEIRKKD